MDHDKKLFKIHIEAILFKIMKDYQNGSQKMKKGIIIKSNQSLKKSFKDKSKRLWPLMPEFQRKSCRLK